MQKQMKRAVRTGSSARARAQRTTAYWHPLNLQNLPARHFIDAVNRILDGRADVCAGTLKNATAWPSTGD
jgi:hypothetical protein